MSLFCLDISTTVLKLLSTTQQPRSEVVVDAPPFLIKTAQLQDLHELSEILTLSFHQPKGVMKWIIPILRLGIYEDLRQRLIQNTTHYACLVAVYTDPNSSSDDQNDSDRSLSAVPSPHVPHGTPIGTVEVSVRQRNLWQSDSKFVYLSNLAVREDCRRQGAASQLLRGCEQIAQQWGFCDIYLHVLDNNTRATHLYHKLGYQPERIESDLFTWALNRPRQVLLHKSINCNL